MSKHYTARVVITETVKQEEERDRYGNLSKAKSRESNEVIQITITKTELREALDAVMVILNSTQPPSRIEPYDVHKF